MGYREGLGNPSEPGDPEGFLRAPDGGPSLLSIGAPEPKAVKNHVHLDIAPTERSRDGEVARLLALGASLAADHREPGGTGRVVLTDPEGNEFCVERSEGERAGGTV